MERSSFFNATLQNGTYDRIYKAEDFARYFATFIGNGIFGDSSLNLQVQANDTNMDLTIKSGKAWINGYMYENTEDLSLTVDTASSYDRIDTVVLQLNYLDREIKAKIIKGEPDFTPSVNTLSRDSDKYELALAYIKVSANVIKIAQSDIMDLRQQADLCGVVTGLIDQIDTTNLFAQYQNEFDTWFEHMKDQLTTDQAGNLQTQIDTWNDFKENGGTVGGAIKIDGGEGLKPFANIRTMNGKSYKALMGVVGITDKGIPSACIRLEDDTDNYGIGITTDAILPSIKDSISVGADTYRFNRIYGRDLDIRDNDGAKKIKITRAINGEDYHAYMRVGSGGQAIFGLTSPNDDEYALVFEYLNGRKLLRPFNNNSIELGNATYAFKDICLNGYIKKTNGYTKLPNGFILQWGKIQTNKDVTSMQYTNYPIQFPNEALNITANVSAYDSNTNVRTIASNVLLNGNINFKWRLATMGLPNIDTISGVSIFWIAIGY